MTSVKGVAAGFEATPPAGARSGTASHRDEGKTLAVPRLVVPATDMESGFWAFRADAAS